MVNSLLGMTDLDRLFLGFDRMKHEPVETLVIDVPEEFAGKAIELVTQRKGDMMVMEPKGDLMHLQMQQSYYVCCIYQSRLDVAADAAVLLGVLH